MRRLNKLARAQHEASAASSPPITAFHSLTEPTPVFVTPDPVVAGFWAESRVRQRKAGLDFAWFFFLSPLFVGAGDLTSTRFWQPPPSRCPRHVHPCLVSAGLHPLRTSPPPPPSFDPHSCHPRPTLIFISSPNPTLGPRHSGAYRLNNSLLRLSPATTTRIAAATVTRDPLSLVTHSLASAVAVHLELSRGGNVTGLLHERLELAHAAQQTHKMFSSWPPSVRQLRHHFCGRFPRGS